MSKNLFPPNGGNPLSSPGLKAGASRGLLVMKRLDPQDYVPGTLAYQLVCIATGQLDDAQVPDGHTDSPMEAPDIAPPPTQFDEAWERLGPSRRH